MDFLMGRSINWKIMNDAFKILFENRVKRFLFT